MIFAAQQLPGLLQTGEYASAIAAATETMSAAKLERLADACRVRQENVLLASQPEIVVVISEAALQHAVGGNDVMCAQLSALANARTRFPRVIIHVLPINNAVPTATGTSAFTILRYAQVDIGMACLPDISGGVLFEDQLDAAIVTCVFEQLKACALTPETSTQLIRHIRETYADAGLAAEGLPL